MERIPCECAAGFAIAFQPQRARHERRYLSLDSRLLAEQNFRIRAGTNIRALADKTIQCRALCFASHMSLHGPHYGRGPAIVLSAKLHSWTILSVRWTVLSTDYQSPLS
ncbi:unnamed protein product [Cercospora beticola]|nr:unnamed protein product [Cercospora beticola]